MKPLQPNKSPLFLKTLELCRMYDIKPARSKGQNFLITESVYDEIVRSAGITKGDVVLEVGPGLGFLTEKLAKQAKKVIAIELDNKLAEFLKIKLIAQKINNVEVVNEDVLKINLKKVLDPGLRQDDINGKGYKIVANLPYNITSIFLRTFLEREVAPSLMVLMLQKEVVERIMAREPHHTLLSLSVQYFSTPEILAEVERDNFYPAPTVDSAIIRLKDIKTRPITESKNFFRILKIAFSAKRKTLKNNLINGLHLSPERAEKLLIDHGLSLNVRAQELSLAAWQKIVASLK